MKPIEGDPKQRNPLLRRIGEKLGIVPNQQELYRRALRKAFVTDYETLQKLRDDTETDYDRAKMDAILHSSACTGKQLFLAGVTEIDPHPNEQVRFDSEFPFPMPNLEDPDNANIVRFPRTP